jgi:hypothetical protein
MQNGPVQPLCWRCFLPLQSDARRAQIGGPAGISHCFQVSLYSSVPLAAILVRNLLSKDRCRLALGDEVVKSGPEVSFVGMALSESRARKRLTRAGSGPDGPVVGPTGEAQGVGPSADSGEEMALRVSGKIGRPNIDN